MCRNNITTSTTLPIPVAKVVLFCLIAGMPLYALELDWFGDLNGKNSGHTTCNFLNLPKSASELSSGMASYGGAMDASDLPDFSANSAFLDRYKFAFTHCEWLMGMRKEYLGALFPVLDVGTFGFYSQLFTPGSIKNARDIDEQPSKPSYIEYSLGATYARSFLDNSLSAGIALSFVESRIEEITGRTAAAGVDCRYAPFSFVSGHLRASSLSRGISYSGATLESLPSQIGLSLSLLPLPANHPLKGTLDLDVGAGVLKTADEPIAGGVHTRITIKNIGDLTIGYEHKKGYSPSLTELSAGASLFLGSLRFSGGWRYYSEEFGPVWAASILHEREELKPRTAEDYYQIAVKHYGKKRYFFCTRNAERALRLDPNLWKAHALISRVQSDILRAKRREIAIVYTGNTRGNFAAAPDADGYGGFARQASLINGIRSGFPLTLCIEAGNMLTPAMQNIRSEFAGFYLDYIGYDATGCGAGELHYGVDAASKKTKQHYILSNRERLSGATVRYRIIEREGYRFFVASYVNPLLLSGETANLARPFNSSSLEKSAAGCDLRILIAHDLWENMKGSAATFSAFDVVICGSLDQHFPSPMGIGNARILSAGSGGTFVGRLTVRFDDNKKITGMENRLFPVNNDITPDSIIANKLAAFSETTDHIDTIATAVRIPQGTFAFVSDRTGKKEIYLKITDQVAEFPLTRAIPDPCKNPVLSFSAEKLVCIAETNRCDRLLLMNLDGKDNRQIGDTLRGYEAAFSPDGKWLYYTASSCADTMTDLYRVNVNGGASFPLVAWPDGRETAPAFSYDGSSMVFGSNRDGSMQLYLTNAEANLPLRITDEKANHGSPAFSPNGERVAYLSDYANFGGRKDLWIFERNGGKHRRLTQRADVKEFCWLSKGNNIVYAAGSMVSELAIVDIVNNRYGTVVAADSAKQWNERFPQTMMLDGKEYIVYTRDYPATGDLQIYRVMPDGSDNTRIVNSDGRDGLLLP